MPFVGIESGKKGRLHTLDDAYKFLGMEQEPPHPGHPTEPESPSVLSDVLFEIQDTQSYTKDGLNYSYETRPVVEISKTLYSLSPSMSDERNDLQAPLAQEDISPTLHHGNTRVYYQNLKNCVAIVCRELLKASDNIEYVIPVRVGFDYDAPYASTPTQWGAILSFLDNAKILLPLALSMRGPNTLRFSAPDQYFLQGWTIDHVAANGRDHTKRQYYGLLTTNLSNFHASPVLHITDVDMLFLCDPESPKWRPRRFSTTWTLYDTILHATYRRTAPVTPVVGVYSDLSVLVNQIRLRGSRVSFMSTPLRKQPFEYLRQEDFRLKHTISESDIPSDLIRQVLLLEHTRQSQDDDTAEEYLADNDRRANTTANMKRRNLMKRNSLFLLLRSGERLVDNKPRCEFYTCPLPKVANSRYCGIHSAEILQIASSRSTERRMDDKENSQLEWNLTSRSHCERELKLLKEYLLKSPQANWIIDFEFLSIRAKSPIPLQVSIRRMDGETLLSTNVDYGISLSEIIEAVTPYTGANIGPFLVRLYKSYRTNGMKPSQIRGHILKLGYSPGKVNIFSWYSAQDMQCFQRILTGMDELIVKRRSHFPCKNFNTINIAVLCRKLLPAGWSCMTLEATHTRLLESQSRYVDIDLYHTAEYDTQAVADIVRAMTEIV